MGQAVAPAMGGGLAMAFGIIKQPILSSCVTQTRQDLPSQTGELMSVWSGLGAHIACLDHLYSWLLCRGQYLSNDENAGDTATGIESKFTGFIRWDTQLFVNSCCLLIKWLVLQDILPLWGLVEVSWNQPASQITWRLATQWGDLSFSENRMEGRNISLSPTYSNHEHAPGVHDHLIF